jgi:hypothetical protein
METRETKRREKEEEEMDARIRERCEKEWNDV